ncbi:hypothetical protein AB0I28_35330 [Phytomonospora sp. NPDC050363]|uniref:hypothetical protein n=1 Tax=Phytomonospora sp. NPDC050363 TaxID=3155642 RepID=UPI0033F71E9A
MPDSPRRRGTSRRVVLLGGLAVLSAVSTACAPGEAHVVEHGLDGALLTARTLLARYDATLAAGGVDRVELLTTLRADHEAHAAELALHIGPGASRITGAAPAEPDTMKSLRKAESAARKEAVEQCVASDEPQAARLLASIAACRAAHWELLG